MSKQVTSGQVIGAVAAVAALLVVSGTCGLIGNSDAAGYDSATKERVAATVTSTYGSSDSCNVVLQLSGRQLTVQSDPSGGACDLKPGAQVQVEMWNGKATAIYAGSLSWPTTLNPDHNGALSGVVVVLGVFIGILALFLLGLKLLSDFVVRRRQTRASP